MESISVPPQMTAQYTDGNRVATWRARKNFWALLREPEALAAAHGLTATSVF